MTLSLGRRQSHRSPNVPHAQPGAFEIRWFLEFRNNAERALCDHLRDEFVRIEQFTADGNKQTAGTGAARIVADICYFGCRVAGQLSTSRIGDLL
jgi:hypothetical protein